MTVKRALQAANRMGGQICAIPAISGGIFTHYSVGSEIKEREQRASRKAVLEAVIKWAEEQIPTQQNANTLNNTNQKETSQLETSQQDNIPTNPDTVQQDTDGTHHDDALPVQHELIVGSPMKLIPTTLKSVILVDLSSRQKGAIHMFVEEFDKMFSKKG